MPRILSVATDSLADVYKRQRIRGLQTHKKKEESAVPGSRTAVNISGVDMEKIRRGDVVAHLGQYQATRRIDARFKALDDIHKPLVHGDEVKLSLIHI